MKKILMITLNLAIAFLLVIWALMAYYGQKAEDIHGAIRTTYTEMEGARQKTYGLKFDQIIANANHDYKKAEYCESEFKATTRKIDSLRNNVNVLEKKLEIIRVKNPTSFLSKMISLN